MVDKAHKQTDKRIERMEKKIHSLYAARRGEFEKILLEYLSKFQEQDELMREKLENGEIDKQTYQNWRVNTLLSGGEYKNTVAELSRKYTEILQSAIGVVNDNMADVYALNYNFIGKDIEKQVKGL